MTTETTSTEVAVRSGGALAVAADQTAWTEQQLAVLRSVGVDKDVTSAELDTFLHECQRTQLDPFTKQIYLIGRWDGKEQRKVFRSQTAIDGYRVVAHRAGRRDHVELEYDDTLWCGPDGDWRDVWLANYPPAAAKVVVRKNGKPFPAVATLTEYAAMDRNNNPTPMWRKMPATMLAKCAEALALRKAFPHDLSGIYTAEEMEQADARGAGPQELTVGQAVERMRRNAPAQPAGDEWSTEPGAPQDAERPSTDAQRKALVVLIEKKRGIRASDRGGQRAVASGALMRPVKSFTDLTAAEASRLIDELSAQPDHVADAEIVPDRDATAEVAAAMGTPTLTWLLGEQTDVPLHERLLALVTEARTVAHLDRLGEVVKLARTEGHLSEEQFAKLAPAAVKRRNELTAPAPAPDAGQADAAGRIATQIGAAQTATEMDGLYNTLVEARDAGQVTPEQFAALEAEMDSRARALVDAEATAPEPDQSWSHQRLQQMTGAAL